MVIMSTLHWQWDENKYKRKIGYYLIISLAYASTISLQSLLYQQKYQDGLKMTVKDFNWIEVLGNNF